ncbi:MAG: hypothetical protein KJO38_06630, partial [Gammaproteobacteria bacterium]|nr:hypothetical protein [Gammaproteobacteria bacterium]
AELTALVRALPRVHELGNAGTLARAVRDSGLSLESRLAGAVLNAPVDDARSIDRADLGRDYKWLLLRVYQALRSAPPVPANRGRNPAPPEPGAAARPATTSAAALPTETARPQADDLQRAVSAGLARIQTLQLGALQSESEPRGLVTVEIPVRSGDELDVVELTVEGDEGAAGQDGLMRAITVRIPVPGRGTAVARVAMAGDAVAVHLSADEPGLLGDMNNMLPELERNLQRAGLNTGHIAATPLPPDEPQRPALKLLNVSI